jgi:hypothetical protein
MKAKGKEVHRRDAKVAKGRGAGTMEFWIFYRRKQR